MNYEKDDSTDSNSKFNCICILSESMLPGTNYQHRFLLKNESGDVLYDGVEIHLIELGKFPILQHQPDLIKSDLDKLLFTMKNAHSINGKEPGSKPSFWEEDWLSEVVSELELAKMSPQQRALVEMSMVKTATLQAALKDKLEEAEHKGIEKDIEKGMERGMEKEKILIAKALFQKGMTIDFIAEVTGLSVQQVKSIQLKSNNRRSKS